MIWFFMLSHSSFRGALQGQEERFRPPSTRHAAHRSGGAAAPALSLGNTFPCKEKHRRSTLVSPPRPGDDVGFLELLHGQSDLKEQGGADLSPLGPERGVQLAVGQQAVLQAGEELEQVASSGEAEWRSLDPVLADQHHRPPAVHCRRGVAFRLSCFLGVTRRRRTHRLDEHVVLAEQEGDSAVLVKRLHVFTSRRGRGRPLVHAAAGVTLLDLSTDTADIR
ncbi:hypothetical protein EYF80_054865 [Liparis tanakae]|uniref:Uncharacterized protein n=1 Tax=Liparis tanakae TaxID=230148 RepID=A0A4Z2F1X6_9TELE|nr:hypothetical protein EYF80_054865 [Liparis tanakae]